MRDGEGSFSDRLVTDLTHAIDAKTKPLGSLGRLEQIAKKIGYLQQTRRPRMVDCGLSLFAADHGITAENVSAFPQEVTRQMVLNFLQGGAAANVIAEALGIDVQVIDAGVAGRPIVHANLLSHRLGAGTANFLKSPAMTMEQVERGLALGREIGASGNYDCVCFGEMGIGNTSSAALLCHKVTEVGLFNLVGRGTGVDDPGLKRKREVLLVAAARTPHRLAGVEALAQYGGFEIAMMVGAMLGAAAVRRIIIVDGFVATAAAVVALDIDEGCVDALVFAHKSAERGHQFVLDAIGVSPLLDLDMRLGEGTGALLAWPIVKSAAAVLNEMSSFESSKVSGPA